MTENTEDIIKNNHILQSEQEIDREIKENEFEEINVSRNNEITEIKNNLSSENQVIEDNIPVIEISHSVEEKSNTISRNLLNQNDFLDTNVSEGSQSTEIRSEITSTKSNISEDESDDDFIPDNISLTLSTFQEENEKLKANIENLELIVSQQQKKINENEAKLRDLEHKYTQSEKIRYDQENRLHLVLFNCIICLECNNNVNTF